jgi:hypothetical protein
MSWSGSENISEFLSETLVKEMSAKLVLIKAWVNWFTCLMTLNREHPSDSLKAEEKKKTISTTISFSN